MEGWMNLRLKWTTEEEEELRDMFARGASIMRMVARLRRSRMAIEQRLTLLEARGAHGRSSGAEQCGGSSGHQTT
jgi:hypothetical protein